MSSVKRKSIWPGRVLTAFVTVVLVSSAAAKIVGVRRMVDGLTHAGIPPGALWPIAILELTCLVLYLFPRTTVLGTFLLTGYFGGATVTHIIGRENFIPPLFIGLLIWAGAYFRVADLRVVLPVWRTRS